MIGTGIDIVYPTRNRELAHRIAEQGCLLSEYPLGMSAVAANFLRRNRLISGLFRGVLMVKRRSFRLPNNGAHDFGAGARSIRYSWLHPFVFVEKMSSTDQAGRQAG